MNTVTDPERRRFLKTGMLATGGLILGFSLSRTTAANAAPAVVERIVRDAKLNAFLRIGSDDTVTVVSSHAEMGQGVYTGLAMLIADELDADWSKVQVEAAPVEPDYNHTAFGIQMTGGSTSTWSEWDRYRKAGATARAMLLAAAAETWKVPVAECRTENGQVIHPSSGRRLSYGALAERAARLPVPTDVPVKDPSQFKLIGKSTKRLDTPSKSDGSAIFGLDVAVPGMLVAVIARPPVFGAKLVQFDATRAKAVPGVKEVVAIDRGVAVVADGFWTAKRGREALDITWDEGALATLETGAQEKQYLDLAQETGAVARKDGDIDAALAGAARKIDVTYDLPYLAHAPMEPLNCVADVRDDSCEVWTGTQFQTPDKMAAAAAAGLKPEQVKLHTTLLGGGFGRRAVPDCHFVREAVLVSKAVKAPVKVVWTREDDITGGFYRPRAIHRMSGGLDATGKAVAWKHDAVCQSFLVGTPFEAMMVKNGVDEVAVEGAADMPYVVPNTRVAWHAAPGGVPTLWWRSVGHSHTAFAVESFVDELAHAAGKDPLEFRRSLLAGHPRHLRLLDLVAEKSGWGKPLPTGHFHGLAMHASFGSFDAQVAEISLDASGWPRVHRVTAAVDCGPVVNPNGVRMQLEGSVVFALTAFLYGEISFAKGRVQQSNFHDYRMVRINEAPEVEVHIMPSTEKMGGVGETAVPPVAPAIANAIFAATGKRIRRLPFRLEDLKTA